MLSFEAVYYDGRTSLPHTVRVSVDEAGAVRLEGDGIDRALSRGDLRMAPRLGDALRSISLPDDQKLETLDNDAVDALARFAGRGGAGGWLHRFEGSWTWVVGSIVGVVLAFGAGAVWGIPLAARFVATRVPDELAHRLGDDTLAVLDKTVFRASKSSPETRARVEAAFLRLAAFHPDLPLHLELRACGTPNAFALPDGTVVVTDELLALAEDDDELAAVIAHEIGHVRHRHGLRAVLEHSSVAIIVGVVLGDVGSISGAVAALPVLYSQAGYSRSHEAEADEFAVTLMRSAGVSPHHFATILRKLEKAAGGSTPGPLQYLSTHPPTEERIAGLD